MPTHKRKDIRDAVQTLLSGQTSAGTNVFVNRETTLWEPELPAILIYTKDEPEARLRDMTSMTYIRTINLQIEIKIMANDTLDDDLDAIALTVEGIMAANPSVSGTAMSAEYTGTDILLDPNSETEKGIAILNYKIQYIQ